MKRLLVIVVLMILCTGCMTQASLTTPTTPLTYGWVMAHHWQDWGVQIGPKVDGDGAHVAVYAWIGCQPNYLGCMYYYFHEYDTLVPGSVHDYSLVWNGTGWDARYDGRIMATMDLGSPSTAIYETNCCERTSS